MVITTRDLQAVFDLRKRERKLKDEVQALNVRKKDVKMLMLAKERALIEQIDDGATIHSNKFIVSIKPHDEQKKINWEKEYRANHPKEFLAIKAEAGRNEWRELYIAERGSE